MEGDPDHPISRGTLCPKGASLKDDITHKRPAPRAESAKAGLRPLGGRSPGTTRSRRIARHIKDTRDRCFVAKNAKGQVVNRNPGMAMIGGCTDTNEFNFLQWKAVTAWGVPYRDTQARV